jgi:secreted PhoX family phosphatase
MVYFKWIGLKININNPFLMKKKLLTPIFRRNLCGLALTALLSFPAFSQNTISVRVNSASDDMEEYLDTAPLTENPGSMDIGSSDLELGQADPDANAQLVGMRFTNVKIPQGAKINSAFIQFTVDATNKNTDPSNLTVRGEATDNAVTFDPSVLFNLSQRPKTTAKTDFSFTQGWTTAGAAGINERTADLAAIIQEIVNRPGWKSSNALALYITGTGVREAESFDGSPEQAPILVIDFVGEASFEPLKPTPFPVAKGSQWTFSDKGTLPSETWTQLNSREDTTWKYGQAHLGYGDSDIKTFVSYGTDPSSKHITTYFAKRFIVNDISTLKQNLELSLNADDAAVVYINGKEVARFNTGTGTVNSETLASTDVAGAAETGYSLYILDKSVLVNGENKITVEVHQVTASSEDLRFDLGLKEKEEIISNPPGLGCKDAEDHISCFTSVKPGNQMQRLVLPSTHTFQYLFGEGDAYTDGSGVARGNNDFTGYIPDLHEGNVKGHLSINHETNPGGVSILDVHYNSEIEKWVVDTSQAVDFSHPNIIKTERNCSGGVTPWGTVITSEETMATTSVNPDGYYAVGWHVEIDPASAKIMEFGTGVPQKLWAMGRISHENIVVAADNKTAYYGEDAGSGNLFKFVADQEKNLYSGKLYALKLTTGLVNNEPSSSVGTWIEVPNTTVADRNASKELAAALGATPFNGIEDAEISPLDGKIYFTAKGNNRVYRFKDNGTDVTDFETFVGGKTYSINYGEASDPEAWGSGNDNLTFDDKGNLYVLQDGSRNHIWMVTPEHTQDAPKVELFMKTPLGSEPTGMTFSPDYKFMFVSIQTPNTTNTQSQPDASGNQVVFNKSTTIVVAKSELLDGLNIVTARKDASAFSPFTVYPNPSDGEYSVSLNLKNNGLAKISVFDTRGQLVTEQIISAAAGSQTVKMNRLESGVYMLKVSANGESFTQKLVIR